MLRMASGTTGRGKLLFLVTEDWYFVSHRLPLAIAAKRSGYDVSVATRVRAHGKQIVDAGLRLIPFENSRGGMNPLAEFLTLARLASLYRRERPDLVHHVAIKPVLYGSIAARLVGKPRVVNALAGMGWLFSSSEGLARRIQPLVRWVLARLLSSGLTIVQNPDDARTLLQMNVPRSKIRRIAGSGVDLEDFCVLPEVEGVPIVVLPARLLWDKGVGEFVAAARLIKESGIPARFVLAGRPDEASPSAVPASQISEWAEEGIVEYLGWVGNIPGLFAESHIVCLPSYYGEGIPKSLIEAAAAGRCIVTTDMPGCREIVHHGVNGLLVGPKDSTGLAAALIQLIQNPELRRRMGAAGRSRVEQEFGLDSVIRQTLEVYNEISSC